MQDEGAGYLASRVRHLRIGERHETISHELLNQVLLDRWELRREELVRGSGSRPQALRRHSGLPRSLRCPCEQAHPIHVDWHVLPDAELIFHKGPVMCVTWVLREDIGRLESVLGNTQGQFGARQAS